MSRARCRSRPSSGHGLPQAVQPARPPGQRREVGRMPVPPTPWRATRRMNQRAAREAIRHAARAGFRTCGGQGVKAPRTRWNADVPQHGRIHAGGQAAEGGAQRGCPGSRAKARPGQRRGEGPGHQPRWHGWSGSRACPASRHRAIGGLGGNP